MFAACEVGHRVNIGFIECNDMIDKLKWYRFPVNVQRMLPIIINYAQQPVELTCFGSAALNRETFKYVCISVEIAEYFSRKNR